MNFVSRLFFRGDVELNLIPLIDVMSVLVAFLLMTAVFSRITILQLDLPSSESTAAAPPPFRLEVIVREQGLELTEAFRTDPVNQSC